MQLTPVQFKLIDRLANGSDGAVLASILEGITDEIADMRTIDATTISTEELRARQIACNIIKEEIIARLKIKSVKEEVDPDTFD